MPILVKLISGGVGLASEAYASRKQSKAAAKAAAADASSSAGPEPPQYAELPDSQAHDLIAKGHAVPVDAGSGSNDPGHAAAEPAILDDDAVWALDEASEEHHRPSSPSAAPAVDISNNALIRDLLARLPPAPSPPPAAPLPCPVILPQRRPREKTRGFVRAYAPVLESAGIDQAAFLAFLKSFHAASQASPIFNVILLATAVVGMVPSTVVMATTAAINAVVIPAQIAQTRYRTNSFLDEANERLFKPRGLYAMIVAFRADADRPVEARALDVNAVLAKYGSAEGSGSKFKDDARKLRFSSAKTYGEAELPVAADLVFPGLEEEDEGGDEEAKKKMKATNKWLADYQDRRAQAKFVSGPMLFSLLPFPSSVLMPLSFALGANAGC
ncbi:fad binding domain protein [Neofusicoccum parvum]|uniref:Fad binding domain protein n=1 Tax=Neofusicoccum parvum TaxID=310453 RepID=A0ACB5SKL6_9PEZI|nr:fad binding domain protein [Neofusicoccum parvum]